MILQHLFTTLWKQDKSSTHINYQWAKHFNKNTLDKNGSTYKYNKKSNELAIISKDGTVITYFKPKDEYNYYKQKKRGGKIVW